MWHQKRRRRLSLETEHRVSLLRNLARELVVHQRIITTYARAKEAGRFAEKLITIAKKQSLHARRRLVSELGSGSELIAKRLIETIAPKFSDRKGGYTRVLQYRFRKGDGAQLALLEFSTPIEQIVKKEPRKKKKAEKPSEVMEKKETHHKEVSKERKESHKDEKSQAKAETSKEAAKKGGFLKNLRKFLTGKDE